jgi:catechol 2,3-dioxygenase-like lactoylglutathione lyase family enzyme
MRIGLVAIHVDDEDHAERFYPETLGFQVKMSAAYGPERWLSVVSPEELWGIDAVFDDTCGNLIDLHQD